MPQPSPSNFSLISVALHSSSLVPAVSQHHVIHRQTPRPHGSQRHRSRRQRQLKLILIHRKNSVHHLHPPDRNPHLRRQQQRCRPREQPDQQQPPANTFQNPRQPHKITGKSVLHEKLSHPRIGPHQLRIPVVNKN